MSIANSNFRAFAQELAPRRLAFTWGQKLTLWISTPWDAVADAFQYAVGARFATVCPEDALAYIGRDRQITRGPSETTAAYRLRLQGAFTAWQWAGTEKAIVDQLEAFGISNPVIIENHEWDAEYPHDYDNWSRFWIIGEYGDHSYTSLSAEDEESLSRLIHQWKAAHVICPEVFLFTSSTGRLWEYPDDGLTWDAAETAGLTWNDTDDVLSFAP